MQAVATYGGKELERETAKRAKEHKLDMEYAIFGLGRDADVKKSVFKAPTVRTDAAAGEMAGLFTSWLKVQGRILLKMLKEKYII